MMRHADSEERLQNVRDHDRPITEAGRACAEEVGATLHMHSHISPNSMRCACVVGAPVAA